jgi:hypothetical protein
MANYKYWSTDNNTHPTRDPPSGRTDVLFISFHGLRVQTDGVHSTCTGYGLPFAPCYSRGDIEIFLSPRKTRLFHLRCVPARQGHREISGHNNSSNDNSNNTRRTSGKPSNRLCMNRALKSSKAACTTLCLHSSMQRAVIPSVFQAMGPRSDRGEVRYAHNKEYSQL